MKIRYLDGSRLRRALVAAADWVDAGREELNRINVFPVPDGDTGTNFTLTLRAVAQSVERLEGAPLPRINEAMAESCVLGAHGNSGMLLSQFLIGFREEIGERTSAEIGAVARGIRRGFERLAASLDHPVEGTILTVCRETAQAAEDAVRHTSDLFDLLNTMLRRAAAALERTPDLLASLKEAGVVDAGGKGFVRLLEGIHRLIHGEPIAVPTDRREWGERSAAALTEIAADRDYQFCTEVLVRGAEMPPTTTIRERLRQHGGSIVVLMTKALLKVHIHTNTPDDVYALAAEWGAVESTKADDMRAQHASLHGQRDTIAIVVDSAADLDEALLAAHGIIMVPMQLMAADRHYRDRIDLQGADIYERMRREQVVFTTSQPTPAAFREAYRDALTQSPEVMSLSVSAALSGTYNTARSVASQHEFATVTNFDSRTVSMGLGMLALRARELAAAGWTREEIVTELDRIRNQSGLYVTFDTFEHIVRSGRVSRAKGWLGGLLNLKPIMRVESDGTVSPVDRVRGMDGVLPRMLDLIDAQLTPRPRRLRMAVMHADEAERAEAVRRAVAERFDPMEIHVGHVAAVIGVHTGPGAWAIVYQNEDGAPR